MNNGYLGTMNKRFFLKIVLVAVFSIAPGCASSHADPSAAREKGRRWFGEAKFGVFVHYLGRGDDWNDKVDSFDVKRFAEEAFNPGAEIRHAFNRLTDQQDYTAGEQNKFAATPESNRAPERMQWHILSFLGSRWAGKDGPTNSDQYMIDYIKTVNAQGGVVTMDVNISYDGTIYEPQLKQLIEIGKAIR